MKVIVLFFGLALSTVLHVVPALALEADCPCPEDWTQIGDCSPPGATCCMLLAAGGGDSDDTLIGVVCNPSFPVVIRTVHIWFSDCGYYGQYTCPNLNECEEVIVPWRCIDRWEYTGAACPEGTSPALPKYKTEAGPGKP